MNELAKDDRLGPSVDKPVAINELASSLTILLESDAAPEAVLQFSKLQAPDQADIVARISTTTYLSLSVFVITGLLTFEV